MEPTGKIHVSTEAHVMGDTPRVMVHLVPTKSMSGSGSWAAAVCTIPQETDFDVLSCLETAGLEFRARQRSPERARLPLLPQ